jgi:hypothetical protein
MICRFSLGLFWVTFMFFSQLVYSQVSKQRRELPFFENVRLLTDVNLELFYNDKTFIIIYGSRDNLESIVTQVHNQTLSIFSEGAIASEVKMEVYAPHYQDIYLGGSGNIYAKRPIREEKVYLELSGSGNIDLELDCYEIEAYLNGSGKLFIAGAARLAEIKLVGSGNVEAEELKVNKLTAQLTGSGNIELDLNPCQEANLKLTGSGNIYYRGSCPQLNIARLGSGRIRQVDYRSRKEDYRTHSYYDTEPKNIFSGETVRKVVELPTVENVEAQIMMASGKLNLNASNDSSVLLLAEFQTTEPTWLPNIEYFDNKKNKGILTVEQQREGWHNWARWEEKAANNWRLNFHPNLTYAFDIVQKTGNAYLDFRNFSKLKRLYLSTGAGDYYCNLENTSIPEFTLRAGIGAVRLNFAGAWKNDLHAEIEGGIGELTLILPREVGVRINNSGSLRKIRAREFRKVGKYYINEAYGQSSVTLYINFTGGIGLLNLRTVSTE